MCGNVAEGDILRWVEISSRFTALDWCGEKFSSLYRGLSPQVSAFFVFALISTHLLIIHCIYCKYVFVLQFLYVSPLQGKNHVTGVRIMHLSFGHYLSCNQQHTIIYSCRNGINAHNALTRSLSNVILEMFCKAFQLEIFTDWNFAFIQQISKKNSNLILEIV